MTTPTSPAHPGSAPKRSETPARASVPRRAVTFFAPPAVWTVVLIVLSVLAAPDVPEGSTTHPGAFGVASSVAGLLFYVVGYVVFGLFFPQWEARQRRRWAAAAGFVCGPMLAMIFLFATMMLQRGVL